MKLKVIHAYIFAIICCGIALRAIVSLHSYSGAGKPPMHGDYEAQRHWQEITVNLNRTDWYRNTTDNDLLYWGLDYPPLTAYHSYAMAKLGMSWNSSFVELHKSRGYESAEHKSFMRLTVLLADLVVYVPGCLLLAFTLDKTVQSNVLLPMMCLFMLYPGQILVDNGHFQYNNISLGLSAIAISSILWNRCYSAAFFFTLALNYKQMELYHALPFFFYLLGVCATQKSFLHKSWKFIIIGSTVTITFLIIWFPWLRGFDAISNVIGRLFPISRGVFEDKVANFWCSVNVVYKLKNAFSNQQMALICLGSTVGAVLPINAYLFKNLNKETFLYSLFNTAMAFFLFSFQVHEKSILLVALPACCLFGRKPLQTFWFLQVTVLSMLPLFIKDGLLQAYFALMFIFHIAIKGFFFINYFTNDKQKRLVSNLYSISICLVIVLSFATFTIPAPTKYPFFWPLIVSLFSCAQFVLGLCFGLLYQFKLL